jgi:hypothetical protein
MTWLVSSLLCLCTSKLGNSCSIPDIRKYRNANLQLQRHSSPPSANTSPRTYPGVEFSDTQAIFNHIHGPEGRSDGRSNRGDSGRTSPNSVLPQDSDSSARRHTELVAVGHRLVENCQHVNTVLDELLASASKLPAKRQSLRMSGTTSRTTVSVHAVLGNALARVCVHNFLVIFLADSLPLWVLVSRWALC